MLLIWAFYESKAIAYSQKIMEWKNWFNVLFTERNRLPTYSGIYAIADTNNCVWYLGQAINLRNRWTGKTHHRYPQLIRSNRKLSHKIYYKPVPIDSLDQQEKHYIKLNWRSHFWKKLCDLLTVRIPRWLLIVVIVNNQPR
ncbi:hypothetical protein NIES2100_58540 [Calothrix sp. NIES-2100]|uniref:GIY-YIG nuclease family protein n=1 Tax=Calothrix sp. NIES-2100 TaxID=1954172 RepID=UPI000B6150F0|nr:hypothetical protein NIES2100_58540 [Calothrix sp. NIES-2100]